MTALHAPLLTVFLGLSLAMAGTDALAQTMAEQARANALLNWAEYALPSVFQPAPAASRIVDGYVVRSYAGTDHHLGVSGGEVFGLGPLFSAYPDVGGGVRRLGSLADFADAMARDGFGVLEGSVLRVTEALPKDAAGGPDWFELHAVGTEPVQLADYQVKDGADDHPLSSLPAGVLNPGEYRVILAADAAPADGSPWVPFKLGGNDRVQLYRQGELVDDLDWDDDEAPDGYSFGRFPGPLGGTRTLEPTPGAANKVLRTESVSALLDGGLGRVGEMLSAQVHDVSITMDITEYQAMVSHYLSTQDKQWIVATVTVDGERYEQVGLRLKGNSSLRSISTSADPATVPWLVKFDKFVDQDHQGLEEMVIRSNSTSTALNEAVALDLLQMAGLKAQDAISTRLQVNGGTTVHRLIIESPDDEWMKKNFSSRGALYKAESSGDYSYRGDNPASYDEVFDQEAGKDNADLTPLIAFLKFINQATDAEFKSSLTSYLDIEAFAIYLAMQDLLDNFDDIDGPGNNSYLYLDPDTGRFTVVPWDYNLAFGATPASPGGTTPGNAGGPGGQGAGGGFQGGGIPPRGGFGGGGAPGGGPGGRSNVLVQRFLADAQFNSLYVEASAALQARLFESGEAAALLTLWQQIVAGSGLLSQSEIATQSQRIAQYLD